jgi:AAHS family 4-hydroxybenzoate transporter-like MFS transporter
MITGPFMDRLGAFGTLGVLYLVGFVFVAATGIALEADLWVLLTGTFFAGLCVSVGQKSLIALDAVFYPSSIRSTGVGWALGIGRTGGILGPLIVGAALTVWPPNLVFSAMSVPMLVGGLLVLFLARRTKQGQQSQNAFPHEHKSNNDAAPVGSAS